MFGVFSDALSNRKAVVYMGWPFLHLAGIGCCPGAADCWQPAGGLCVASLSVNPPPVRAD